MNDQEQKLDILGIPVDRICMDEALTKFQKLMDSPGCSMICTPNSEILYNADKDSGFADILKTADMVIPDGIGLVYASKMLGQPLKERVTGIDFSYNALKLSAQNGWRVYFLGSKPGIAELAAEKLKEQISGLEVAGFSDGYFKPEQESDIISLINESGADFLLCALGSPKQERFISKYKDLLCAKCAVGIGGSLDVWSGTLERAPQFYIDHGLEWLYRLIQEPSRIGRVAALPLFLLKVSQKGRKNADRRT